MRTWLNLLFAAPTVALTVAVTAASLRAQDQSPPQTARQALIEMFMGKTEDAVTRHLPDSARKTLAHNGDEASVFSVLRIPMYGRQMIFRGGTVQTFDDGPAILVNEPNQDQRIEVAVERDGVAGDTEEIELSVHFYRDGQEQWLSVIPRLTFVLQQQKTIWRLVDFTAAARVPLGDAAYLHGLKQQQIENDEYAAKMRVDSIVGAEAEYAERHPDRGYTCGISTLFAPQPAEDASDDAPAAPQLFDPGGSSPEWSGYRFKLSGCEGSPASKYEITAVPLDADSGAKTFCADESATVRALAAGKVSACFTQGEVVSSPTDSAPAAVE